MSVKKVTATKSGAKKTRPSPTHPSWVDMIKECIAANPEDARSGVSRPQIKKYVEEKYNLAIDNAQLTHLSKAITSGAEKGTFVLPKGPSGRVKLPPKTPRATDTSASKELPKARPAKTATTKATTAKATTAKATTAKATTAKATAAKKPAAKAKTTSTAGKKSAPVKKTISTSKRGTAKKAITGTSAPTKAKVAATKKATAKKPAVKAATSTTSRKKVCK
ncbi:hypothetical protein DFH29DRAFT_908482 [Suillus ampliporus]|nr:hypothetical protein DFH29DRAFT_908482 [Suillus ampliporus]